MPADSFAPPTVVGYRADACGKWCEYRPEEAKALLAEIHRDSALCLAPVFVLTTSALDADVAEAYRLRAAGYITKRDAGPGYERVFDLLDEYVDVVRLPDSVAAH